MEIAAANQLLTDVHVFELTPERGVIFIHPEVPDAESHAAFNAIMFDGEDCHDMSFSKTLNFQKT